MSINPNSSVSIIIAAYNSGTTIERAVKSALAEAEASEVVVADDFSTDNTCMVVETLDDKTGRLKLIRQNKNAGPAAARNRAIKESTASWVAILDADDFFLPGRLKGLLSFSDGADFVADNIEQVDENNLTAPRKSLLGSDFTAACWISFSEFVLSNVSSAKRHRGELGFIKPIIRRSFLEAHKLKYHEEMRLGEDYDFYARALAYGAKLRLVPAQGYVAVMRADSLSGKHSEEDLLCFRNCDMNILAIAGLTEEDQKTVQLHYRDTDKKLQWRLLIKAVKGRDVMAGVKCFGRSIPVSCFLLGQLWKQIVLRSFQKLA